MTPGDVLLYKNFRFSDQTTRDKLMVVLGPSREGKVLVALTTSQQHKKPLRDGCHTLANETVFTFNANLGGFNKTTWIILKPFVMTEKGLLNRISTGAVGHALTLARTDLRAIINCGRRVAVPSFANII